MDDAGVLSSFFRLVFGPHDGYVCIGARQRLDGEQMRLQFFHLPNDFAKMLAYVEELKGTQRDIYYCPQLYKSDKAGKDNVLSCPSVWADLDACHPSELETSPTVVVESSPGRFQALWITDNPLTPEEGEEYSKRIAYKYAEQGADQSGWDLSQLLRVPTTVNHKYRDTDGPPVVVRWVNSTGGIAVYRLDEFEDLPQVTIKQYEGLPFPERLPNETAQQLLDRYRQRLRLRTLDLYTTVPQPSSDGKSRWSEALFALEMDCFEAGMAIEEVYKVCISAACNKFDRDRKSSNHLWQDVCRAYGRFNENVAGLKPDEKTIRPLMSDEELERVKHVRTFVDEYVEWASGLGDAAAQYHQGGAFIILCALLAGNVSLPTSFGRVVPNLWFMILGDTTLTRKSTAMDLAMELLLEVDAEAIMATDGSVEGLMQGLSTRPGTPSIFLRDEFSGLLDQIARKEYYAGMTEVLTKMYDGKLQKRLLKKETIEVRDPVLMIFAGGIKRRVQQLLTLDQVSSGFVPRFIFLTAESDVSKLRPLGPPSATNTAGRQRLLQVMINLRTHYQQETTMVLDNGVKLPSRAKFDAELTPEAWARVNQLEELMLNTGLQDDQPDIMTPMYDRLTKSTLKAAILLAAARQMSGKVIVTLDDVLVAIRYATTWRQYALEIVNGIGRSAMESQLDNVVASVRRTPGISRAALMRRFHLTAREADIVFGTLEQRGLVARSSLGRGHIYHVTA